MLDYSNISRRFLHCISIMSLTYYIVPENMWIGISRNAVLLSLLLIVYIVELLRHYRGGIKYLPIRKNEESKIASYVWACTAIVIALLFFPVQFSVPSIIGWAFVDPLIGELRRQKLMRYYPVLPVIVYILLFSIGLQFYIDFRTTKFWLYAIVAMCSSIGIESIQFLKERKIDDDFSMIIVPLVLLTVVNRLFP